MVPCGRTVVSSMHCGCSNPGSNLGQGSILLSGSRNMTLLFATSSYMKMYEHFALSVALRTLYLYALFTERAPKDFGLLSEDRFL